jgi:predicted RND superfamily exporter protein/CRP-like cAMP-binding protein
MIVLDGAESEGFVIRGLANLVTRHALWVVAVCLALTAGATARLVDFSALTSGDLGGALRFEIDPSMTSLLPEEDPARDYYEQLRNYFGNDETLLLAVRHPTSAFDPDFLAALQRTTESLYAIEGIRDVVSLANADDIRSVDGDLVVAPLFEGAPSTSQEGDRIRRAVDANPILKSSLLSDDGRTTAIVAYLEDLSTTEILALGVDTETLEVARREFAPDVDLALTGGGHVKAETQRFMWRDLGTTMPAIMVVLMGIAFVSFRSTIGVVVPMSTLGIAIVWTLGLATFFFPKLNVVTISVPAILTGVGFAYSVHIVSAYYEALSEQTSGAVDRRARSSAAGAALQRVGVATFLTCLTTGVGFAAIALSPLPAVREFGLMSGLGVACLFVTTSTFAPALLTLLPAKSRRSTTSDSDWIHRALERLADFDIRHRRRILAVGAGFAVLSVLSIGRIEISTDVLENFPKDLEIRRSIEAVNDQLGGADQVYVVLESENFDAFKEPDALRRIASLQEWLEQQPEVGSTTSVADYVQLLNRAFHEDDPKFLAVPESRELISQLLLIGGSDDIDRLVDSDYSIARIPVRISAFDSADVSSFADRVDRRLEELPAELSGSVTGLSVLIARTNDDIAYGQAIGLLSAFVIIYAILSILFTSLRAGMWAMIPNVLPVVIYFGALGWLGITLNVVTGLVACLVLGIAVDDTVHFLSRFNALARERANSDEGVRQALVEVGRAVSYTSAALCAGFFVLTASTLQQQVEFGALAAFTLAVAWVVDITFTPALASRLRVVTLWELMSVDLGDDPVHTIGLFDGLRPAQARRVALAGSLVDVPAGRKLYHAGEQAQGLFVLVTGSVRTWVAEGDPNLVVARYGAGETVGEVGLFHGEHASNAEVEKNARLLRLDERSMNELHHRSPRIAALLFRNTSRLLAGRLALQTKGQQLGRTFSRPGGSGLHGMLEEHVLGNVELQLSLGALGIDTDTQRALDLIPMIEVAWADGELAGSERESILRAAATLGIANESRSHALLSSWLVEQPDPSLYRAWRDYVTTLVPELSVEGQLRLQKHVVERVRAVAEAAGGVVGLRKISVREERIIAEVMRAFGDRARRPLDPDER